MQKVIFIIIPVLVISILSCKGPQGDPGTPGTIGPKGDTGATGIAGTNGKDGATGQTGATGQAGTTGATGAKGETGTANVIYSNWTQVNFSSKGTFEGIAYSDGDLAAKSLDQKILDTGVVLVYAKDANNNLFPVFFGSLFPSGGGIIIQNLKIGTITLRATDNFNPRIYSYRYVLIPGGVPSGRLKSLQSMDYEQIIEIYNLQD